MCKDGGCEDGGCVRMEGCGGWRVCEDGGCVRMVCVRMECVEGGGWRVEGVCEGM